MKRIRNFLRSFLLLILLVVTDGSNIRNNGSNRNAFILSKRLNNCIASRGGSAAAGAGATSQNVEDEVEGVEISVDESSTSKDEHDDEEPSFRSKLGDLEVESEEDNDEEEEEVVSLDRNSQSNDILLQATTLRQKGKELHDRGNLKLAADVFSEAASILIGKEDNSQFEEKEEYLTDYCTCRLHEALCRLKMEDFESCVEVCTSVLALEEATSPPVRARAHHRRAKAHLQLGNEEEALQDARSAAFLGDRKAVALYGKLMRGSGSDEDTVASPPMLRDLLQGKNPFLESLSNDSNDLSSPMSILGPLLGKSDPSMAMSEAPSLLGKGGTGGSLAKSLLSSLTKRLESDPDMICKYLQKAEPAQIQSFGALANVPISKDLANKLAHYCHKVTPKLIRSTIKLSKGAWYSWKLVKKTGKVVNKYKHLLILWALFVWIQSAIQRPFPISKKAAKMIAAAQGSS